MIFQVLAPVKISAMGQGTNPEAVESEEPELEADQGILDSSEASEDTELGSEVIRNLDGLGEEGSQVDGEESGESAETGEETQPGDSQAPLEDAEGRQSFHLSLKEAKRPNGEEISESNALDLEEEFYVYYSWKLDNGHGYKAGDKVNFKLPKGLKILVEAKGELADGSGKKFADYELDIDGNVSFTFTKAIEELSNISGDFWILSKIDREEIEENDGKLIIKDIEDFGSLEIPIKKEKENPGIYKWGELLEAYNTEEIKWNIEIDPNSNTLDGGKLVDILPEGLSYKKGSLEVDGRAVEDFKIDGKRMELDLGKFESKKLISYITIIDHMEEDEESFVNEASYEQEGLDKIQWRAGININRGKTIEKLDGLYDSKNREITWQIKLNLNGNSYEKQTIEDSWDSEELELIKDSISFFELDANGQTNREEVKLDYQVKDRDKGFDLELEKIDRAYLIEYKTKVKDVSKINGYVHNMVKWDHKEGSSHAFVQDIDLYKTYGPINYKDKTMEWHVVANRSQVKLNNLIMEDQLGPGLKLKIESEDDFRVIVGGYRKVKDKDYTLEIKENSFKVKFIGDCENIEEYINISYKTSFDYSLLEKGSEFTNRAKYSSLEGDQERRLKEVETSFTPNDYTQNNGFKSGSYNAVDKTISWTVGLNYQQNQYDDLKLIDKMLEGQKLKKDSIKVFEALISEEGQVTKGAEIKAIKSVIDEEELELSFGSTNAPYIVEYQTSLKDLDYIEKSYSNKAEIMDGKEPVTELEAVVPIPHGSYYGLKKGVQNGKMIDWTVTLNPSQSKISNLSLVDKLSANQELIKDSIKVYATEVAEDGSITKGKEYKKVELDTSHENGFSLKFEEAISEPYVVEYSSIYFASNGEEVSNGYKVSGEYISASDKSEGIMKLRIMQTSGGSASGKIGRLRIKKVDAVTKSPLEGAEFKLLDADSNSEIKNATTASDGTIDFGRLLFGNYKLVETKAPEGYKKLTEPIDIEIDKEYVEGSQDKVGNFLEVENEPETPGEKEPGDKDSEVPGEKPTEPGEKEPETPTPTDPVGNEPTSPTTPGEKPETPGEKDTETPGENKPTSPTEPGEKEPVRPGEKPKDPEEKDPVVPGENKPTTPETPGENKPIVPEEEDKPERPGEKPKDPTDPVIPEEDPSIKDGEVAEKPEEDIVAGESAGKEEDKSDINGDNKEGYESGNIGLDNSANRSDEENSEIKGDKEEASDKEGSQAKLPATGESSKYISLLAGLLILALGLSLWNKKEIKN